MSAPSPAPIPAARLFAGQSLAGRCLSELAGIGRDSRRIRPGQAYVAMGAAGERAAHCAEAVRNQAGTLVVPGFPGVAAAATPALTSPAPRWSFARASAAAHGLDARCLPLLGVTGTKGKSSIAHLTWWMLGGPGRAARVGTIGWHDGASERPNPQTTPPPEDLHAFLASLPRGLAACALELSSHGCDQHRLAGLRLRGLAYTGLGHDHLDYHGTRAGYLAAKLRAVRLLDEGALLVVNADDAHAGTFAHAGRAAGARVIALGQAAGSHRLTQKGPGRWTLATPTGDHGFTAPLPGDFNAWNCAAAAFLAAAVRVPLVDALARLGSMPAIPGRMELLAHAPATYVDYAHTPESIGNAVAAARSAHPGARLAIVFGCGGDKDRSKRAPMGAAASAADVVVLTDDNPRGEDPAAITAQIRAGVAAGTACETLHQRAEAIVRARGLVGPAGVVVVAGKGHETSQIIGATTLAWDDRAFVRTLTGGPT